MMTQTRLVFVCLFFLAGHVAARGEESGHSIRDGHNLLEEGAETLAVQPGDAVGLLSFTSVQGEAVYLGDAEHQGPAVLVFMSTECPLAKRYTMRLRRLHEAYAERGVRLYAIFPNSSETDQGVKSYSEQVECPFPCVRDVNGYLAKRLGATMTPQAFLLDRDSVLRYRGAIDDNRYENRVAKRYLADALDAVLSGDPVENPSTKAMGCSLHLTAATGQGDVTYSGHIARILQDNCQACHRPGQVAPFALENYDDAVEWQTEIQAYTHSRVMPPWKASREVGDFKNDISLSDEEIQLIAKWVSSDTPMGDPRDMPPPAKFNDGWALGEPDLIVEMPEEYVIGPEGEDDYRHFVIPYEAVADRFIEAVDVQPGNRNVVHHVIGYVDTSGKARELDAADEGPGYTRFGDVGFKVASIVGGWAPGSVPSKTPEGTGRWLPKKCDIILQVHYYRTGIEERDRTKIGLYFSKAPRPVPTRMAVAINRDFKIPAGDPSHTVKASCNINEDAYLFAITPHMHLLGETMDVTATLPDGQTIPLIRIDDWDFNWQIAYQYRQLQFLPSGTRINLVATFDNSVDNPNNPNPEPKVVGWGEKTTDEMCIAFLGLVRHSEYDPDTKARREAIAAVAK